jgi:hypothetical protein
MLSAKIPIMPSHCSLEHFDRGAMVRAAADEAIGSVKRHPDSTRQRQTPGASFRITRPNQPT